MTNDTFPTLDLADLDTVTGGLSWPTFKLPELPWWVNPKPFKIPAADGPRDTPAPSTQTRTR